MRPTSASIMLVYCDGAGDFTNLSLSQSRKRLYTLKIHVDSNVVIVWIHCVWIHWLAKSSPVLPMRIWSCGYLSLTDVII